MSKTVSAGTSPKIRVEAIDGDLSVVGWDGSDILIKGDDEDIHLEHSGSDVSLSSRGDLSLRVPKASSFEFVMIGGDASIRGVTGNIEVKEASGDLSIRDVGSISIDSVRSDLSLRGAKGNLYVKSAHGDVSVRDVEGNVTLESVADDLALRGARGNIKVNVGEDVVVYLDPKMDGAYSITAGDDILLVLLPNANVTLSMQGDEIDVDWPGVENQEAVTQRVLTLGDGSAKIMLSAGGNVRVTNKADAGESAEEFGNFAGLNFDWSGFGEMISRKVERATGQVARRAEEAAHRAEKLAGEAARRAERHAERHARRWKANVGVGRWNWDFNSQNIPTPPAPPPEPVADEERMAILKMLQEKKITAEQAEQLLNALEGGK
ncbi:MAG: SHOCT-like domain-containing protein [Anaerolineales bacterium]